MARQTARPKRAATSAPKTRQLRSPQYRSFRLHKRIKVIRPPLTGSFRLFGHSLSFLKQHWRLFGSIMLVFGLLKLLLGVGFSSNLSLNTTKPTLDLLFRGSLSHLATGLTLFGLLLSSAAATTNAAASVYQLLLLFIVSLAVVWALRQTLAEKPTTVRVRDAFYKGMYPLVPFGLVLLVVGLQLLPLVIGGSVYNLVISNGIAVTAVEKAVWLLLFGVLALLSLYMVSSSLFALYIVTLPDMTPLKALRSARQLVLHRRWLVLRKILFLPVALLVFGALITIPLIIFATPLAQAVFFAYSTISLAIIHGYMYHLYRELL